jgi:bifunctional non-homologous end joining protein LigD
MPDLVALKGSEESGYGKVSVDYTINDQGKSAVAPYSLVAGESPTVATPLLWEELKEELRPEEFNHETIFKRLKRIGDPFESFSKKKVNADDLLDRLQENYDFLL